MATFARGRSVAASRAADGLLNGSRTALELLDRTLGPLELLGGGPGLRALCHDLAERIERDEALIGLGGMRRTEAVTALMGEQVVATEPAAGVTVRVREGAELRFRARWTDGRSEASPPDRSGELERQLAELGRQIVAETDEVGRLSERLQEAARAAAHARTELAAAEEARAAKLAAAEASPAPAPPRRPALRGLFARLLAFLRRLFFWGRALPSGQELGARALAAAAEDEVAGRTRQVAATAGEVARIEAALGAEKAQLSARSTEREQRRRELELYRVEHHRNIVQRLLILTGAGELRSVDVEVEAPGIPERVVLLLRAPTELWREPVDARLIVDDVPPAELRPRLEQIREQRPSEIARKIAAALCDGRNQIVDGERRARTAHEHELAELSARRIRSPEALRREQLAGAQRALARQAHQIVEDAATRLESLLGEVRGDWERRIDGCGGIEQLRAEVGAIENGAAHRLTLVCDELRESMTVEFVRLVLDLSRPLRQELLHRRLEVARGGSAKLEETFEDVRVVLPGSLETAFQPLRTAGVGQLLSTERGLLDPLLRTLGREKRGCVARLAARLDDIQSTTTRELYASAVFISPLLLNSFTGLLDELLAAHERWIAARAADEERAWKAVCEKQAPALALVGAIQQEEARLAGLLEAYARAVAP